MTAARLRLLGFVLAAACLLPSSVQAEDTYDDYGLVPDGGGGEEMAWPEPNADGRRPEHIAPDEAELDPFDERAIELEPEVKIAPDYHDAEVPPPPSAEKPEPLLPPVEQLLKEGPTSDPRALDPTAPQEAVDPASPVE